MDLIFKNYRVSGKFGEQRSDHKHGGIDFAMPQGTRVQATTSGTVKWSGYKDNGYGKYVIVEDANHNQHYYAHMSDLDVVTGDKVTAGQQLGLSGNTGRSTGAHLHYEVRDKSGTKLNPQTFIDGYDGTATSNMKIGVLEHTPMQNNYEDASNPTGMKIAITITTFVIITLFIIMGTLFLMKTFDVKPNVSRETSKPKKKGEKENG